MLPLGRLAPAALATLLTVTATHAGDPKPGPTKQYLEALRSTVLLVTPDRTATACVVDVENKLLLTTAHAVGSLDRVEIIFPVVKNGKPVARRSYYLTRAARLKGKVIRIDARR